MRIVTRADFDGIVCTALLYGVEKINKATSWVEPNDMQHGLVKIESDDIIANLPFVEGCALWFDHHYTNQPTQPFQGSFKIAPSAARVIFDYYGKRLPRDYSELISQTDDIDSANLTLEQVRYPEKFPYLLISMTISSRNAADEPYWNHLVQLFQTTSIDLIMADTEVKQRCLRAVDQNKSFEILLHQYTQLQSHVAITDFRSFNKAPEGNRFLVYSLFPDARVAVKIRYAVDDPEKIVVSVGHSIFNCTCRVNIGRMLSGFGGGGHAGAGAAAIHKRHAEHTIRDIIDILVRNEEQETNKNV